MYRLLSRHHTNLHSAFPVPSQIAMQLSARMCSYCNFQHRKLPKSMIYLQNRGRATTLNPLGQQIPIKKTSKPKKYVELLEISHHVANRRAAVQKLNASDVSILLNQPEITMDKLHKLKDPSFVKRLVRNVNATAKQTTKDLDNIQMDDYATKSSNNELDSLNRKCESEQISESIDKFQRLITATNHLRSEKKFLSVKQINEKSLAFKAYTEALVPHIDVYLATGKMSLAVKALLLYRGRMAEDKSHCDNSIVIYNKIMEYCASQGDLSNALYLYNAIRKDSITPTAQTYAYLFEIVGRLSETEDNTETLQLIKSGMDMYGISENDIFTESSFKTNQWHYTLNGIQLLIPNFKPSYPVPKTMCDCKLLEDIQSLSNNNHSAKNTFNIEELRENMLTQIRAECQNEVAIESIAKHEDTLEVRYCQKLTEIIEKRWEKAARMAFRKSLHYLKEKERKFSKSAMVLHPFLEVLDEQEYVDAIMREIRTLAMGSDGYTPSRTFIQETLGERIYTRYSIKIVKQSGLLDSTVDTYLKYLDWYLNGNMPENYSSHNLNHRAVWQMIEHEAKEHGRFVDVKIEKWPSFVLEKVGQFLFNIILNDIKVDGDSLKTFNLPAEIPAFYTVYRFQTAHYSEQLKPHPVVTKIYNTMQRKNIEFDVSLVPSYTIPRPWTASEKGVYFMAKADFIRPHDQTYTSKRKSNPPEEHPEKAFYPTMDALNQLGCVPWIINCSVLDVAIKIFQDGGSEKLSIPLSATNLNAFQSKNISKHPAGVLPHVSRSQSWQKKSDMYSLWCDALYRLSIANHFRDKKFWLPHNLDFRGRAYTIPPHLSHLGADLGRSLLLFAERKPLGPKGLDWLKIHVINLTGLKKRSSLAERLKYANENLDNIIDSSEKPLTGKMWWAESEEPWQTLAACMEVAAALKSPNPEEYLSGFPVHQDGSCNGLQHYAALGRDEIGAKSVNLHPCDVPQDVYSTVTNIVEKHRAEDAKKDINIAKALEGHVERKVIKQTIMTTVYGVTKYGAKLQIKKQLKEKNLADNDVWRGSTYMADTTFKSLASMFKSAREIQQWLVDIARIVTTNYKDNIQWYTPLGLPVVQPYQTFPRASTKKKNGTTDPYPNKRKQRNAFAPNFIHSLDSSHMMLTCLKSEKMGITFAAIHDCYWTHACTVDNMNKICREKFIALHSEPILENLAKDLLERYSTEEWILRVQAQKNKVNLNELENHLKNIPSKGNFDIKNVMSSVYFFS